MVKKSRIMLALTLIFCWESFGGVQYQICESRQENLRYCTDFLGGATPVLLVVDGHREKLKKDSSGNYSDNEREFSLNIWRRELTRDGRKVSLECSKTKNGTCSWALID